LDLAYHGAPFHGFARQPGVRTVQGDVEAALAKLFHTDAFTAGAGRTDAGVHALGQVMTTSDAPGGLDTLELRRSLNAICGPAVAFTGCAEAAPDFHARFSARSRTYVYAILAGEVPDPFLAQTSFHHPGPLDVDAMNEAAGHFLGPHDFSSFGRTTGPERSAERTLFELSCTREGRIVRVRARANAFIQQMVRSLVGTLIQVGEGRREPSEMTQILGARDRAAAGPVAAAHGLCLVSVEYDEGWSRPLGDRRVSV
jgi:tRNA pseudouridine38-40 synthase